MAKTGLAFQEILGVNLLRGDFTDFAKDDYTDSIKNGYTENGR
jgi:hypothetical protein